MSYSVILVDDEPWSMIDITHSIDWGETGFHVIGTYESPREAAEAIVHQKPDVVFTDIRMPGMDGFELIEKCRKAGAEPAYVILSSYSDFSYAQQAIKAAVADYCLKPIDPEALRALLAALHTRLQAAGEVQPPEDANDFERILAYTRENYTHKLLLSDISEQFSFHRNYICHLFKKNLNTSFSSYINTLRIEEAKQLLLYSALSVEEIAARLGLDHVYFCKLFKKQTSLPPAAYRKSGPQKGGAE